MTSACSIRVRGVVQGVGFRPFVYRLADFPVVVNCDYIPRIQEVQASVYHVLRESLQILHQEAHSRGEA